MIVQKEKFKPWNLFIFFTIKSKSSKLPVSKAQKGQTVLREQGTLRNKNQMMNLPVLTVPHASNVLNIKFCKQVLLHRGNVKKLQCFLKWLKADYLHEICRLPVLYMSFQCCRSGIEKEPIRPNESRKNSIIFAKRLSKYCFSPKKCCTWIWSDLFRFRKPDPKSLPTMSCFQRKSSFVPRHSKHFETKIFHKSVKI